MAIRTIIFSASNRELDFIESKITDKDIVLISKSNNLSNASDEVGALSPDLVIISTSEPNWSFRACQQIYMLHPQVAIVMVSEATNVELSKRVIEAGATSYIAPIPEGSFEFCSTLKQTYYNVQSRLSMLLESSGVQRKAELITVFSTKGGLGKTTIATNLAVALSKQKAKVCIVDLDLQFGDVHMFLGLDVKETISELIQDQRIPTIDSIRNYFVTHASGVQVICAPSSPEYSEGINSVQIEPIINILRAHFDYVIIDTASNFSEINLLMLELSSKILFVTGLDISVLHNSKKGMLLLDSLNLKNKISLVVSKDFKGDISVFDVEKILGNNVEYKFPNDLVEAVKALNQGVPIISSGSKSGIVKEMLRLASVIGHTSISDSDKKSKKFELPKLNFGGKSRWVAYKKGLRKLVH